MKCLYKNEVIDNTLLRTLSHTHWFVRFISHLVTNESFRVVTEFTVDSTKQQAVFHYIRYCDVLVY